MKKAILVGLTLLLGLGLLGYAVAESRYGGWGMGSGPGGMMGRGGMMGPGGMMMGPGSGSGPCQQFWGETTGEKLTKERAETLVKRQLTFLGNPNLKVGSVKEETTSFVAEIVTKDNSLVDRLRIDKETGIIRPIR